MFGDPRREPGVAGVCSAPRPLGIHCRSRGVLELLAGVSYYGAPRPVHPTEFDLYEEAARG